MDFMAQYFLLKMHSAKTGNYWYTWKIFQPENLASERRFDALTMLDYPDRISTTFMDHVW